MKRGSAIVGLVLAGCTSYDTLAIDLIPPADMKTLVIGVDHKTSFRAYAVDLDLPFDGDLVPPIRDFEGSATVYALYYGRTLEEFMFDAGEIVPESDKSLAVPLEDFDLAFKRQLREGDDVPEWEDASTTGDEYPILVTKRPPDLSHCPDFSITEHAIPTQERFLAAAAISEDEVLAFGYLGDVFRITTASVARVMPTETLTEVRTAARAPNGEVWVGAGPDLLRGHPEVGYRTIHTVPDDKMHWSDAPPTGDLDEVVFMTERGKMLRATGGVVTLFKDYMSRPGGESDRFGGVAWVSRGQAVGVPPAAMDIIKIDGPRFDDIQNRAALNGIHTVSRTGDGRYAILLRLGSVFTGRTVDDIRDAGTHSPNEAFSMAEHREGFLYARRGLRVVYGELDREQCNGPEPDLALRDFYAMRVVRMSRTKAAIFGGTNYDSDESGINAKVLIVETTK